MRYFLKHYHQKLLKFDTDMKNFMGNIIYTEIFVFLFQKIFFKKKSFHDGIFFFQERIMIGGVKLGQ